MIGMDVVPLADDCPEVTTPMLTAVLAVTVLPLMVNPPPDELLNTVAVADTALDAVDRRVLLALNAISKSHYQKQTRSQWHCPRLRI
jgi:hypothetical protein